MKKQSGFSVIEVIMVVLIIGLIGAVGWLFYQNVSKTNSSDTTASSSEQSTSKTDTTSSSAQSTDSTKYLAIKEWGVKLPVPSGIADLGYSINTDQTNVVLNVSKGTCEVGALSRKSDKEMDDSGVAAAQAQWQAASNYTVDKHFGDGGAYMYEFAAGAIGSASAGSRDACATDAIVDLTAQAVGGMAKL